MEKTGNGGAKVPLTAGNVKEGLAIRCSDHPEWGEFRVLRRYMEKTWEIHNDRGVRTLFQDEFRFWELVT